MSATTSRRIRLIGAATLLTAALTMTMMPAYATRSQDELRSAERGVTEIEAELSDANADLQDAKDSAMLAEQHYADAMTKLVVAKEESQQAKDAASAAKADVEEARNDLGDLVRMIYTSTGSLSDLEPYMSDNGIERVQNRQMLSELFGDRAANQLTEFQELKRKADKLSDAAEKALNVQQEAADAAEDKKKKTDQAAKDANDQVAQINHKREALIAELARARGVVLAEEQERQRKLAEEQAAAAAAAQQAALQAALRQAQAAPAPARTVSKPVVAQSGSGSGSAIVKKAMSYVGYRYTWGGNNPEEEGVDCSGFTRWVYSKVRGINLPRLAEQQRYMGYGVSMSQAVPGDLVCYEHHVGIYLGNGMLVHAANPSMGIIVGSVYDSGTPTFRHIP
ncbi:MAG: NlpC/P60 family protein [Varibaculum sp.]|nr:NlpC/P60 family protein [Varibaculum sp.]